MVIRRQTCFERSSRKTCRLTACGRFRGRTEVDSRTLTQTLTEGTQCGRKGQARVESCEGQVGFDESVEQLVVPACEL